jgi:hypothetical protein
MSKRLASLSLLAVITACGPAAPLVGASPLSTAAPAGAARLELGEIELVSSGKTVTLHASGGIESGAGTRVATLTADGRMLDGTGKAVATLGADGRVMFATGSDGMLVSIAEDGTLTLVETNGKTSVVKIDADGTLSGGNPAGPALTVKGANTAGKRRAAMMVLVGVVLRATPAPPPKAG